MTTYPKPKIDLFNDSPCLVSKKSRTSTPSLKPPKPPTKSSKGIKRRARGYFDDGQYHLTDTDNITSTTNTCDPHEGSFSFGLNNINNVVQNVHKYSRMYQKFDILSKIGSGYFADVYKAKSLDNGQYYAIKRTSIPFTSNSDRLRKLQEVKNHQSLPSHPNCVRYYDSWEEDGYVYIQTELCKTSLNGILETSEDHKLPEKVVWSYLLDLLSAVKHLHDHDLLHMDIKPDNIFISFDDVAKLGDFGLMCKCSDLNSSTTTPPQMRTKSSIQTSNNDTKDISMKTSESPDISIHSDSNFTNSNANNNIDFADNTFLSDDFDDSFNHHNQPNDHDDSGIINRSDESIDSIDEGDSKYLASETMQGKFTKAADIFSLGITIFEVASGLDLPQRGETYHKLRQNEIDDLYFNGLSADLVKVIKMMMEKDYTKRPTVGDLLKSDAVRLRRKLDTLHNPTTKSIN